MVVLIFFYRRSEDATENNSFRPFLIRGDATTGLAFNMGIGGGGTTLQTSMTTRNTDNDGYVSGGKIKAGSGTFSFLADTNYHIGVTTSTDAAGNVTMNTFVSTGLGAIDTGSSEHLISSVTFNFDDSIVTSGMGSGQFQLGIQNVSGGEREEYFDTFRIYNDLPSEFTAIPEPAAFAFSLALLGGGLTVMRRKRRV